MAEKMCPEEMAMEALKKVKAQMKADAQAAREEAVYLEIAAGKIDQMLYDMREKLYGPHC